MNSKELLEKYCITNDLSCYDPYDIWKTSLGGRIKATFYENRYLALIPASLLTIIDLSLNNRLRLFYQKQEYPIVRAYAIQILLNLYKEENNPKYKEAIESHLDWLIANSCKGYSGYCWGLNFDWPAGKGILYDKNTPFTTHTPYVLESFISYRNIFNSDKYNYVIKSVFDFLQKDVKVLFEDEESIAFSYGPISDRIVMNSNSYLLYSYALFSKFLTIEKESIDLTIKKLYNFIKTHQREDGSWLYNPFSNESFIDCFHSCFVLKNLIKTGNIVQLDDVNSVIQNGYTFLQKNFYDCKTGLYRRFSMTNKPNVIRFDLYDNAEMLNLSYLLGDVETYQKLSCSIHKKFVKRDNIYSKVILGNFKVDKDTFRWAVFPYLYALSKIN